jgi:amino acid transporter
MDETVRVLKGISAMIFAIYLVLFVGLPTMASGEGPGWIFGLWLISPLVALAGFVYSITADPRATPEERSGEQAG